jgi:CubicO group peptidase (beta-lactamase class C family)
MSKFFPGLPYDFSVLQLLTHTSGLPEWQPLYLYPDPYLTSLAKIEPLSPVGEQVLYSCIGFIWLYFLIEKVSGDSYINLARSVIFDTLGLRSTYFIVPEHRRQQVAPTEMGNSYEKGMAIRTSPEYSKPFPWRTHLLQGETHDGNSHYAGGTAGNSGLFSTAGDLLTLSGEFFPQSATILNNRTVNMFWHNFTPRRRSHRSVGFKINSSFSTSAGRAISKEAIGHNGFTGTSIWMEPQTQTTYIILTNRVHPDVKPINFDRVRKKIHQLLKKEL